jgi:Flp pilus assembly protein TadG
VEFAVGVTFALILLFGIIQVGQALFTYDLVANAARIGTRYAIVRGSACTVAGCPTDAAHIQSYVQGRSPGVNEAQLTVTAIWGPNAGTGCPSVNNAVMVFYQHAGCLVTVSATYPFHLAMLFNFGVTMKSTSQMVISQ